MSEDSTSLMLMEWGGAYSGLNAMMASITSASIVSGAGVPGVISTAKVTEKLILKDYGTN